MAAPFFVRRYRTDDLEYVRDVCFATGLMGDPVAGQFGDRDTFAHLFCDWYLLYRPDSCWVVDDGTGRAVGYLIGSPDAPDESAHQRRVLTRHLLGRGVILRPDTMGFFGRAIRDLAADRRALASPVDHHRFPAEMHMNLMTPARGRGLGSQLIRAWFDHLADLGVPGVHLATFGENGNAIGFFLSQGFVEIGRPVPNPGFRLTDGSRATVVRFQRDLA